MIGSLTPRPLEVFSLLARGYSNPTIAQKLSIDLKTVERHISTLYQVISTPEGCNKRVYLTLHYQKYYRGKTSCESPN